MFARVLKLFTSVKIGTLVTTDYGLRTGGTFGLGRDIWVLLSPCVVEGFHIVQRGVVRGTEDGMKK